MKKHKSFWPYALTDLTEHYKRVRRKKDTEGGLFFKAEMRIFGAIIQCKTENICLPVLFESFCLFPVQIINSCIVAYSLQSSNINHMECEMSVKTVWYWAHRGKARCSWCEFTSAGWGGPRYSCRFLPAVVSNYLFVFEADIFEARPAFPRRTLLPFSNTFSVAAGQAPVDSIYM